MIKNSQKTHKGDVGKLKTILIQDNAIREVQEDRKARYKEIVVYSVNLP